MSFTRPAPPITPFGMTSYSAYLRIVPLFALVALFGADCRPVIHPNLGVEKWKGTTLDGKAVQFSDVKAKGVVLNFYSPTCAPCIEELPAFEAFAAEAAKLGVMVFVVVEGQGLSSGVDPEKVKGAEFTEAVRRRIDQDRVKYGIKPTIVILDPEFKITQRGPVTGTPETLFFRTNPFLLHYAFVGPISTEESAPALAKDTRYQFALGKLRTLTGGAVEDYRP